MRAFIAILALSLTSAVAVASEPVASASKYDKPGYVTAVEKGRLWVFKEGSKELDAFRQHGEPTVSVAKIGSGPEGMTVKGPSMEVIDAYLASQ
jgi:hypothetical protein